MIRYSVWAKLRSERNAYVALTGSTGLVEALELAKHHRSKIKNEIVIRADFSL